MLVTQFQASLLAGQVPPPPAPRTEPAQPGQAFLDRPDSPKQKPPTPRRVSLVVLPQLLWERESTRQAGP